MRRAKYYARVTRLIVALAFLMGAMTATPKAASADPGLSKWSRYNTPSHEDLLILPGSDIINYAVAGNDGQTVYAIGAWYDVDDTIGYSDASIREGQVPRLWKSADGGASWTDQTEEVQDARNLPGQFVSLSAVAAAPDDPDLITVAGRVWADEGSGIPAHDNNGTFEPGENTDAVVVVSDDGAENFAYTGAVPDTEQQISCMAISMEISDIAQVAAGTAGGKIWRYEAGLYWGSGWIDTSSYDGWYDGWNEGWADPNIPEGPDPVHAVTSVAFSPNFDVDEAITAIVVADADNSTYGSYNAFYLVAGKWDDQDSWNTEAGCNDYPVLISGSSNIIVVEESLELTDIALPYDYKGNSNANRVTMVSVNGEALLPTGAGTGTTISEGGYIFFIENSSISSDLLMLAGNPWIYSIAYHGAVNREGKALAGLAFPAGWTAVDISDWQENGSKSSPCCQGIQVLRSETLDKSIARWDSAEKPPTGQVYAKVAFTPDGAAAYASTAGDGNVLYSGFYADESAFSTSLNDGDCWNQLGLIDTDIDYLADITIRQESNTAYLASINLDETGQVCQCDSVWRSIDNGNSYTRVWCRELGENPDFNGSATAQLAVLGLAPEENAITTIYMADRGSDTIYYSDDHGLCRWAEYNTGFDEISDIAVVSESTLYALNRNGELAKSTTHGRRWSEPVESELDEGHSLALRGDWLLAGGADGKVSYSDDGGESFEELGDIGSGKVHVAFDSYFEDNGMVYAAVSGSASDDRGIYRSTVADADFENINVLVDYDVDNDGVEESYSYFGIVLSSPGGNPYTNEDTGGVLYAAYYIDGADGVPASGVARCLNPAADVCCGELGWDYLKAHLDSLAAFNIEPRDLDTYGCLTADTYSSLCAVDSNAYYGHYDFSAAEFSSAHASEGRIWLYEDCFAKWAPVLTGIEDSSVIPSDPCQCGNKKFALSWERVCNACEYEIEIARDREFRQIVMDMDDFTSGYYEGRKGEGGYYFPPRPLSPSLGVIGNTLDCSKEYFWRVRSHYAEPGEEIRSQWSAVRSFITAAGPEDTVQLTIPADSSNNVAREDVTFTWSPVSEATSYDFTLRTSSGTLTDCRTGLTDSFFTYRGMLEPDTSYFWQVKALKDGNVLSESAVSTFRTASTPAAPPETPTTSTGLPTAPATTPWVWLMIGLGVALLAALIVLVIRTRRL